MAQEVRSNLKHRQTPTDTAGSQSSFAFQHQSRRNSQFQRNDFLSILVNVGPPLQVLHARVPILKLCFEGELEARSLQSQSSHTLFAAKETKAESLCAISSFVKL
jgi:hypothetical protein